LTLDQIRSAIEEYGFEARQRDVFYQLVDPELEQRAIAANRLKNSEKPSPALVELVVP
jgi:cyclic dehypoxanthinyl futalosine synthase